MHSAGREEARRVQLASRLSDRLEICLQAGGFAGRRVRASDLITSHADEAQVFGLIDRPRHGDALLEASTPVRPPRHPTSRSTSSGPIGSTRPILDRVARPTRHFATTKACVSLIEHIGHNPEDRHRSTKIFASRIRGTPTASRRLTCAAVPAVAPPVPAVAPPAPACI